MTSLYVHVPWCRSKCRYCAFHSVVPDASRSPSTVPRRAFAEDCAAELVEAVASVLSDDPAFFLINSYTTGLSPASMQYLLLRALPERLRRSARTETGETCLPVTETGLLLPSGASVRTTFD